MSDGSHSNAVRLQSLALIAAAFVTTAGAVTSAFIQSGWIKKPAAVAIDLPNEVSRAQAKFTGAIEPLEEGSLASAPGNISTGINEPNGNIPTAFYEAVPTAKSQTKSEPSWKPSAFAAGAGTSTEKPRLEEPRVLSGANISKQLMGKNNWLSVIGMDIFSQPAPRPSAGNTSDNTAMPKPTYRTPLPR